MPSTETAIALSGFEPSAIDSIEEIKHGLTNESWLVSARGERRVVRLSTTQEEALQIDRASEANILQIVSGERIGPDVIVCDPSRRLLVTRYMGATWTNEDTQEPANIGRIGELLQKLHALDAPWEVRRVDLLAVVEGYLRTLDEQGVLCELNTPQLRARACGVAITLHRSAADRLCHNDVHALNVVEGDDGLRLLDWEYAGVGQPMFDLASICVYHQYDGAQRERLLTAYAHDRAPSAPHQLELACWLFEYVRDLWMAVRAEKRG